MFTMTMCPSQKAAGEYVYGTLYILILVYPISSAEIAGNLTIQTYDIPQTSVSKPACQPINDGVSTGCLRDGVVTTFVFENFNPITYTYTFCMHLCCAVDDGDNDEERKEKKVNVGQLYRINYFSSWM
jgi:hypothetical protein